MKMEKTVQTVGTKEVAKVTGMSNGRVKLNRIIGNLFRKLFMQKTKMISLDEVSVEGCFSNIQKEKNKLNALLVAQDAAIVEREDQASVERKAVDDKVKDLEKEIETKKEVLQKELESLEGEKSAIAAEKERCDRVCKRMDEFFA